MADEKEIVEYEFIGDSSQIEQTVKECIGLMEEYIRVTRRATKAGDFKASAKSIKKMNAQLARAKDPAEMIYSVFKNISATMSKNLAKELTGADFEKEKQRQQSMPAPNYWDQAIAQDMRKRKIESDKVKQWMIEHSREEAAAAKKAERERAAAARQAEREKVAAARKAAKEKADAAKQAARAEIEAQKKAEQAAKEAARATQERLSRIAATAGNLKKAVAGLAIGKVIEKSAKESITFFENVNLFKVAMGDSVKEGERFVQQMSIVFGMDPSNLYRYAGYFYQLADAIEMPAESASKMALSLTKASNDIASLFNMPIERVTEDMASGLQGMTRAVRKYGMDIRITTLKQTAMTLGLDTQIQKMSEADRQGLRYITMMRQASNANGDFANTIEQPANQLRIFREQMSQLGRAIGDLFVRPLAIAIQHINGFVMALRMILTYIGTFIPKLKEVNNNLGNNSDKLDDTAASVAGVGSAAKKSAKQLNSLLAPFDELNVLQEKSSGGVGDTGGGFSGGDLGLNPAIAEEIANMEIKLENVRMKALDVRDAILSFLGFTVSNDEIVGWDFNTLLANLDQLGQTITEKFPEWATYVGMFATAWFATKLPLGTVFDLLKKLSGSVVSKLFGVLKDGASYTVPAFSGSLGKCGGAVASLMGKTSKLVSFFSGPLTAGFAGIALAGAAVFIAGFVEWMVSSDDFKEHIAKWKESLGVLFKALKDLILAAFKAIKNAIHFCATNFDWLYDSIADVIGGLLDIIAGLADFIAGAFTGDWKRAWQGVLRVFKGVFNGLWGIAKVPINAVIGLINGMISAITSGINHCIRMINTLSFDVPDWVPLIGGQHWGFDFGYVNAPQIPKLARGGVITSPTMAMIGEGTYDEAVIPLGNSPQMSELVDRIVDATSRRADTPIQVCVYIGDDQIAEYIHQSNRQYMLQTNGGV